MNADWRGSGTMICVKRQTGTGKSAGAALKLRAQARAPAVQKALTGKTELVEQGYKAKS